MLNHDCLSQILLPGLYGETGPAEENMPSALGKLAQQHGQEEHEDCGKSTSHVGRRLMLRTPHTGIANHPRFIQSL